MLLIVTLMHLPSSELILTGLFSFSDENALAPNEIFIFKEDQFRFLMKEKEEIISC